MNANKNRNHRTPEPTPFLYQSGQQLQPSQRLVSSIWKDISPPLPGKDFFVTRTEGQINARLSKSFLKETLTITFTANDILRTGYFHFDLYGIDAIWKIGFTGISNASASKYPINSMPPRANIKEPEPDKAKKNRL